MQATADSLSMLYWRQNVHVEIVSKKAAHRPGAPLVWCKSNLPCKALHSGIAICSLHPRLGRGKDGQAMSVASIVGHDCSACEQTCHLLTCAKKPVETLSMETQASCKPSQPCLGKALHALACGAVVLPVLCLVVLML